MTLIIFITMMTSTAFCMSLATNPLSLGLLILLMAMTLSMAFATSMSSWVAFLIFLIYVGGMLVMFSYFVSIIPNQTLSSTIPTVFMTMFTISTLAASSLLSTPILFNYVSQMNILYNHKNMGMLMILASILMFTMVIVVKIASTKKAALRPFSKYV